jgi:hypothetical protein
MLEVSSGYAGDVEGVEERGGRSDEEERDEGAEREKGDVKGGKREGNGE